MKKFVIIWLGQLFSLVGSGMTRFVLALWLWEQTGEATALVLVGVFSGVASLIASTFAGPLVDRWSRKKIIIVADLMVGVTTVILLILAYTNQLEAWHIYLMAAFSGLFGSFHVLSFMASITLIIPKEHYTRANSLLTVADYGSAIGAPILAGLLIGSIGIGGVMLVDVATFLFAVGSIALITIPPTLQDVDQDDETGWRTITFGFRYIFERPSLRNLLIILFTFSMAESFSYSLISPMILARTGGDEVALGIVLSVLGVGGVVGGIIVTVWGGFRRKIDGVLIGLILTGVLGDALMGIGRGLPVWLVAAIGLELFIPLVGSSNHSLWQIKIPPAIQGRVFAARRILSSFGEPVAALASGLLVDRILEPAMMRGGIFAPIFGNVVGVGPGAGMGLIFVICGLICAAAAFWGYLMPSVRNIESILPDFDAKTAVSA